MSSPSLQAMVPKLNLSYKEEVELCQDTPEWDDFVFKQPHGSIYHLSVWKTILERSFPHIRGNLICVRDLNSKKLAGALPIYVVRSWLLGNRMVSSPFASFCDPLLSATQFGLVLPVLQQLTYSTSASFQEFRPLRLASVLPPPTTIHTFKHHYLPINRSSDEILSQCSKSSIRRRIKTAQTNRVVVTQEFGNEAVHWLHQMVSISRQSLSLPSLPIKFLKSLSQAFTDSQKRLLIARHGGEVVAALLSLRFREWEIFEYYGGLDKARDLGANQLLFWENILASQRDGYRFISFGRTSPDNQGLLDYKRHWGAIEEDQPIYVYSSNGRSGAEYRSGSFVYSLARSLFRRLPKPIYSLASKIIYRHLG